MDKLIKHIKSKIANIDNQIIKYRRHIHKYPELSFNEYKTTEFIKSILSEYEIKHYSLTETGTMAIIGRGEKCVALRADIDALPITEETGLEFASVNSGIMHACGHDFHTSMLLGAAIILKSIENELKGTIKLIFQPAEEKLPGGAKILIEKGVLENPKPSIIFAQHIYPDLETGKIAVSKGTILSSADELYWSINGKGTHAAQPHLGSNVILAQAHLIITLMNLINQHKNPLTNALLSICSVNGGNATNIIPEEVKLMGTFRSFDDKFRNEFHQILLEKSQQICGLHNCTCKLDIIKGYPPLINNDRAVEIFVQAAKNIVSNENIVKFEPKMWAEDFAYYSQEIPACFWFLGVKPKGKHNEHPLHNPKLNPDEKALSIGTQLLALSAIQYFEMSD